MAATTTFVEPDTEGFTPNGFVNPYPHGDFDGPCTGQCCFPDEAPKPLAWTCEIQGCFAKLRQPGECINCTPLVK